MTSTLGIGSSDPTVLELAAIVGFIAGNDNHAANLRSRHWDLIEGTERQRGVCKMEILAEDRVVAAAKGETCLTNS